jgi:hypothetical protein
VKANLVEYPVLSIAGFQREPMRLIAKLKGTNASNSMKLAESANGLPKANFG